MRSLGQWIIESLSINYPCSNGKKVQDCDYAFGSSTKFQRGMNGFVKADVCRQVSVCLHVFCGILFALKPLCDYSLCSVCILLQSAFYSQSVVCILHSVCILPLVRSLQSVVRSLRFTLTDFLCNNKLQTTLVYFSEHSSIQKVSLSVFSVKKILICSSVVC